MESRKEQAAEKKRSGTYNCAQSVMCTYCDYAGIPEDEARNIGNSFAVGMGNMEGTCGALVGAGIVLGLATKDKAKSMRGMRSIMERFPATKRCHTVQIAQRQRHRTGCASRMSAVRYRCVRIS